MKEGNILNCEPGRRKAACRGHQGEQRAAEFLMQSGLRILQRNFRCRRGEVDLVARDGDTLVFVEVRWRTGHRQGGAGESIDRHKRRRLVAAARFYLMRYPAEVPPCRFDAILLEGWAMELHWLKDIFWL
ncbi:MAG: YraN family protein [Ferrovum sp.]|nr:YraN family protein [Ferrovum sp.]